MKRICIGVFVRCVAVYERLAYVVCIVYGFFYLFFTKQSSSYVTPSTIHWNSDEIDETNVRDKLFCKIRFPWQRMQQRWIYMHTELAR